MQTGYEGRCILDKSMWKLRIKILSCARMNAWTFELREDELASDRDSSYPAG